MIEPIKDKSLISNLLRKVVIFLGFLPLRLRVHLGRAIGYLFSFVPTPERRIACLQLDTFLKDQGGRKLVPQVYASFGQTILETLNLRPLLDNEELHIECPNMDALQDVLRSKRGTVALTAHTGNWELMAAFVVRHGISLATVGREARVAPLQEILAEIRNSYGVRTLWRANRSAAKDILTELRDGKVVAALIDQDTRVASVLVPFFGRPARSPSGLLSLAQRCDADIVSAFITRVSPFRYRIEIEPISAALSVEEILTIYHERLEALIRRHPEQWVWFHKRWRSSVSGDRLSSRQYIETLTHELSRRRREELL